MPTPYHLRFYISRADTVSYVLGFTVETMDTGASYHFYKNVDDYFTLTFSTNRLFSLVYAAIMRNPFE